MAQNVTIAGAAFSAVPAIEVPKTGGGIATFADPSGTTATASDVAQGKYFLTSAGVLTEGTASGGGGTFVPKMGVIRPDAELLESWVYDKLYVHDLGNTLPSYSTSAKKLISGSKQTVSIDIASYRYFVCYRYLAYPVYSSQDGMAAKQILYFNEGVNEFWCIPSNTIKAKTNTYYSTLLTGIRTSATGRIIYWSSTTNVSESGTLTNGVYMTASTPTYSSGNVSINVYVPSCYIKGNTSVLSSDAWATMKDIHCLYAVKLYRVPYSSSDLSGWETTMQFNSIINCWNSGGTLT